MTINVNQRVTPVAPVAGEADTPQSLENAMRLKKKKCRHPDLPEGLVTSHLAQAMPRLDAALTLATKSQVPGHDHSDGLSLLLRTAGEAPQASRLPTQPGHGQDHGVSAAHLQAAGTSSVRHERPGPPHAVPVASDTHVVLPPRQAVLSVETTQLPLNAPAPRNKLRILDEGTALGNAAQYAALTSSDSAPVMAEDAWFTAQATPVNPPMEQVESPSGMKLSYPFLRWGGGRVDISAQPNQLLFQPSTEMVRERLGESLLARPQSPSWQMDEHPDRRHSQQQHQNDEDEC